MYLEIDASGRMATVGEAEHRYRRRQKVAG